MPQIGDIRKANHQLQMWAECEWCHKPRWVGIRHNIPRSKRCMRCHNKQFTDEELKTHNREYAHRHYKDHKDHINEVRRQFKEQNPERYARIRRLAALNGRNKLRQKVVTMLGGECARCGFKDMRALQLDHKNGGGCKERRLLNNDSYKIYKRALEVGNKEYQILCANCNRIKAYEELGWLNKQI